MNRKLVIPMSLAIVLIGMPSFFLQPTKALGDVRILSHSSFYDSLNSLWVVGDVENTGDMATRFTKITATFNDASNQVIITDFGYSELDILLPGRRSPFNILLLEAEGALEVHNYTLTVSWDNYAAGKALGLEILSNSNYIDGYERMHVTEEIENQGSMGASFVKAIAAFYDSSDVVVGLGWDYTEPSYLLPDQRAHLI